MVFVFQAGSPGLELMWDREREGPGTGAHNDSCISLYQEPGWRVPNLLLQTKKASSFMMLEILTYFVHKIVLIKKTVFLDVILTSRYETGGWFNTSIYKTSWVSGWSDLIVALTWIKSCFTLKRNGMHLICHLSIACLDFGNCLGVIHWTSFFAHRW